MTEFVKRQIIAINQRLRAYRTAYDDAVKSGVSSASVSSGGASQSYTRMSLDDIAKAIARMEVDKARLLAGNGRRRTAPNFI